MYRTEQNPKKLIWLRRYLFINHEEVFLNGMALQFV